MYFPHKIKSIAQKRKKNYQIKIFFSDKKTNNNNKKKTESKTKAILQWTEKQKPLPKN